MFVAVLGQLVVIVALMLVIACVLIVGSDRLVQTRYEYRDRFRTIAPYAGLLAAVLIANKIARDIGPEISWLIGIRITDQLKTLDGWLLFPLFGADTPQVVVWLQSIATPELTAYFSFAYIYGYVFLVVFPLVAYFMLQDPVPLRRTIVAYGVNYLIGVICYVVFIAYGPRNLIIESAEGLLYSQYAQYQFVTTAVNDETNVFPSLHASLAVTAALLAWTTRDKFSVWFPLATVLAVSVVISTMYLGIHWASDAVFGIALAWISVKAGRRFEDTPVTFRGVGDRFRAAKDAIPVRSQ